MKTTSTGARDTRAERRGSRWTDERIREELQSFLADRTEWPTYREFERNGRKALRDAITQAGGAERWAQEMGVRFVRHPPGYAPVRDRAGRAVDGRGGARQPTEQCVSRKVSLVLAQGTRNRYPALGSATEGGGIAQLDPEGIGDGEDTARRVVERRG